MTLADCVITPYLFISVLLHFSFGRTHQYYRLTGLDLIHSCTIIGFKRIKKTSKIQDETNMENPTQRQSKRCWDDLPELNQEWNSGCGSSSHQRKLPKELIAI